MLRHPGLLYGTNFFMIAESLALAAASSTSGKETS
jgi:hypothetical protein